MSHELNKEELSAYIDGELTPARQAELVVHLGGCQGCAAYVERLKKARVEFKTHGVEKVPAKVLAAVKPRSRMKVLVPVLAALVGLFMLTGIAFKRFLPGLFSQIQGMISGAANEMGK
ncbi:MAG: zf-HC2 domain-containing protein [Elusimicrobiota bacterium]